MAEAKPEEAGVAATQWPNQVGVVDGEVEVERRWWWWKVEVGVVDGG